jgi:hypothetical protein
MDELLKMLNRGGSGGSNPLQQLAQQFGLSPEQAEKAVRGLAPALTGALGRNARSPGGLESLQSALQSGNHGRYVDEPASLADPATTEDGNAILGHLLGSKDESRRVAGETASSTGIDADILKKMLPLLASLVMGSVSKQASGGSSAGGLGGLGGLTSILEGLGGGTLGGALGGAPAGGAGQPAATGGIGGLLGKIFGRR